MNKQQIQSQIKVAADTIEAQEAEITALKTKIASLETEKTQLVAAKTAAEKDSVVKVAAETLVPLAKAAADKLFERGMFTDATRRDQFAAKIASDHTNALNALVKAADYVETAQKVGTVVESTTPAETADDVWNKHITAAQGRLPGASAR